MFECPVNVLLSCEAPWVLLGKLPSQPNQPHRIFMRIFLMGILAHYALKTARKMINNGEKLEYEET